MNIVDILTNGFDVLFKPFYLLGVAFWNMMLSLIGLTAVQTPQSFSRETWLYVCNNIYPWMLAAGAMILNISFYIGFIRQANNLKESMTMEAIVDIGIKTVVANALMRSGLRIIQQFFDMASFFSGTIFFESPVMFIQENQDVGSAIFYSLFGVVFFAACMACSITIFLTVYGRYLQLYLLVAVAPVAISTLPGGTGMSQSAYAWIRTFLAKVFEIVLILMALVIGAKMCNSLDFGTLAGIGGVFDGAIQAIQNICTMVLLTASVKGMDVFMRRAFAL